MKLEKSSDQSIGQARMKVLFVLDGLPMGGAERNTLVMIESLASLGVTASICTLNSVRDTILAAIVQERNIPRHDLGARHLWDIRGWMQFLRLVRAERYDCIHIQDPYGAILGLLAKRVLGIPVVMTRHVLGEPEGSRWARLRNTVLATCSWAGSDHAILVADALRRNFQQQYAIPAGRVSVIHNGVPLLPDRRSERPGLRKRLGWDLDAPIAIMAAVMRPGKGHDALMAALPAVLEKIPNFQLKLAGSGSERDAIKRAAQPFGSHVELLGERADMSDLLSASDFLVLPSESEALPTVLLEAGMAGIPAIATGVGGVREIIDHGHTGIVVALGDRPALAAAMLQLAANPTLARRLGDGARRRAETDFSSLVQARRTRAIYGHVIEHRSNIGAMRPA